MGTAAMRANSPVPVRALVIDDSEISREVIRATLEARGWIVHTLESALGATAAIVRHQTNVLVVDVNMPVMSGGKFVEVVSSRPRARGYRVERGPNGVIETEMETRYLGA